MLYGVTLQVKLSFRQWRPHRNILWALICETHVCLENSNDLRSQNDAGASQKQCTVTNVLALINGGLRTSVTSQ